MPRNWQPPAGPVPLAADHGTLLTPEERRVAELQASLRGGALGAVPAPPPGTAEEQPPLPPLPDPTEVEKLAGLCRSDAWDAKWRAWVAEQGVTRELVGRMTDSSEKPVEVMVVYQRFLEEFERLLSGHCAEHGISEKQLHLMCQDAMKQEGVVKHYLTLVLDQADFTSFAGLLSQYV